MRQRRYLFLQGCTGPFFARLGDALRHAGHGVHRINFNTGDRVSWRGRPACAYRGTLADWPVFLEDSITTHGITDAVMLGDTRAVHQSALAVMDRHAVRAHVLEEGYFRPSWLTLEANGINGHSRLPRDPDWYRAAAAHVPHYGDPAPIPNPLRRVAAYELGYRIPNLLDPLLHPGFVYHRESALREFYGWARRFAKMPRYERQAADRIQALIRAGTPFYVLPLQLASDSQMREHSDFHGIPSLAQEVINSFLRHAPVETSLVIKNHPLDTGFVDYRRWIDRLARRLGLGDRVVYLEAGHMPTLLHHAQGVVTVNSTVGTSALLHGRPLIALGAAIYDLPGLTFQGGLDAFWQAGEPPDRSLYRAFRDTVIHTTQVEGGFYSPDGVAKGVAGCAAIMQRDQLPLDALMARTHGRG